MADSASPFMWGRSGWGRANWRGCANSTALLPHASEAADNGSKDARDDAGATPLGGTGDDAK